MPIPSRHFTTPAEYIAYVNSLLVPNGMKAITGEIDNNAVNGIFELSLKLTNNYDGADIFSNGGNITLSKVFNVITGTTPTTLKWVNPNLTKEYYVINTTDFAIPLFSGFSYFDAFLGSVTAIPANSSIHIVLATNGLWIQFYNPTGEVIITNPIVITAQPQNQTVTQGQSFSFSVTASGGVGLLTYQWRHNGVPISGEMGTIYDGSVAQIGDAGTIDVVITDSLGNIKISNPATFVVNVLGLQKVYVGMKAEDDAGNPTEFEIVTGNLTMQNAVGNVIADWTSFQPTPRFLWIAIEAVSSAAQKNHWQDNVNQFNQADFAVDGVLLPMVIVSVQGIDFYVTTSGFKTAVANSSATWTLSKI